MPIKKYSLSKKLLLLITIIVLLACCGTYLVTLKLSSMQIEEQFLQQTSTALNKCQNFFNERKTLVLGLGEVLSRYEGVMNQTYYTSISGYRGQLDQLLWQLKDDTSVDIVEVISKSGVVLSNASDRDKFGLDKSGHFLVETALSGKSVVEIIDDPWVGPALEAAVDIINVKRELLGVFVTGYLLDSKFCQQLKNIVNAEIGMYKITSQVIGSTIKAQTVGTENVDLLDLSPAYWEKESLFLKKRHIGEREYNIIYTPVKNRKGELVCVMSLSFDTKELYKPAAVTRRWLLILILISIGIAMGMGNIFIKGVTMPINVLLKETDDVAKGNFSKRIKVTTTDEIGELSHRFNEMCDSLEERDNELSKRKEKLVHQYEELQFIHEELITTQKQLVEVEKGATIGTLAGGIAHEVNTPLGNILVNVDLLLMEEWNDFQRECLTHLEKGVLRCRELIQKLLKFSRTSTEQFEEVDINFVINEVCLLITRQLTDNNVEIKKIFTDISKISGIANELSQLFTNINLNAIDAIIKTYNNQRNHGVVEIKTYQDDKFIYIEFKDDGSGIPEEYIGKIFDPFFTTKEVGKGEGLGLAVSLGIVKRHNGKIEVNSQVGKGTIFKIKLPINLRLRNFNN